MTGNKGVLSGNGRWGRTAGLGRQDSESHCRQAWFSEVERRPGGGGQTAERTLGLGLKEMLGLQFHTSAFNVRTAADKSCLTI